ncbi:MAG TPA: TetR family transcriptional regulator [Streptosporangiaceae bacterium]|nr:TetR family transcriptional regulator [Streptosporangiaceae bacterium]
MFIAHGYDQVTIAEIAQAAGAAKMTVTNYFPRQEDLVIDRAAGAETGTDSPRQRVGGGAAGLRAPGAVRGGQPAQPGRAAARRDPGRARGRRHGRVRSAGASPRRLPRPARLTAPPRPDGKYYGTRTPSGLVWGSARTITNLTGVTERGTP